MQYGIFSISKKKINKKWRYLKSLATIKIRDETGHIHAEQFSPKTPSSQYFRRFCDGLHSHYLQLPEACGVNWWHNGKNKQNNIKSSFWNYQFAKYTTTILMSNTDDLSPLVEPCAKNSGNL